MLSIRFAQRFCAVFGLLCVLAHTSFAQNAGGPDASGYTWETITHRYDNLGSQATSIRLGNDGVSSAISIGFDFEYYGQNYTQVYVSANGFITFLANQDHGCCAGNRSPNARNPNGLIAGYWEDLNPNAGGQVRHQVLGNAPNRRWVVDFADVPHNSSANLANFQIALFEGRGDFEIRHQNSTSDGGIHEVGFEDQLGNIGLSIRNGDVSLTNTSFRVTARSTGSGPDQYGYTWAEVQSPYQTAVNASQISLGDDTVSRALDIGFPFTYYGEQFTQLFISSNGFISFLPNQGPACCNGQASPNTSTPNGIISAYWGDLNPSQGGTIWHKLQGNAPNRQFIVEFVNVPQAGGSHPVTFSVTLHEGRGDFEIQHRSCVARNDRANYATGFENRDGTDGLAIRAGNFSSQNKHFRIQAPVGASLSGGPDAYGYVWEQTNPSFEDIQTSTQSIAIVLQDDQVSSAINLGFDFTYYGTDHQNIYVSSNGFISFLANQGTGCCAGVESPNRSGPNAIIAGYWHDLNPAQQGQIRYERKGLAPNRRFIVQYNQVAHSGSNSTALATFQIVLFENGDHFEIRLRDVQSNGGTHSTGFENATGEHGLSIRHGNYSLQQVTFRITAPTSGGGPDAFGYRWVPVPHNYQNITPTIALPLGHDQFSTALPLGFSFRYYGQEYTSARVSSNGFLTFLDNQNQGCCTGVESPSGNNPNAIIAGYWEDLNPSRGGQIWYSSRGSAPNRRFVVHFDNVPHAVSSGGTSTDLASFQIVLFEQGNNIEIRLVDVQSDGGTHSTGFENETGLVGLSIRHGNYAAQNTTYRVIAPTQDAGGPDSFGYRWAATQFHYDNIANSSGLQLNDDEVSNAIPIGFPFSYYGQSYTQAYVSSNGFISFSSNTPAACCQRLSPPDSAAPNNIIAGYWGDLNPQAGGQIWYQTIGAAPNRKFIIQFTNIQHARSTNTASFQIVLYEGPGNFEIRHQDCASDGSNHVTGFEDPNGSLGLTIREGVYETQNLAWRVTAPVGASGGPDAMGYRWVVTGHSFEDISNTNQLTLTDDAMSSAINIGFDFVYYRRIYNRTFVSPNGFITFLANQSGGCCGGQRSPDRNNPNGVIAGYWEDLSPPTGGSVWHDTRGTAPNRRFIVQYQDVPHFGGSNLVTMQIVLYEGRGDFEIRLVDAPSDGGASHATGFENHDGSIGLPIAHGNYSVQNRSYRILAPEPNSAGGPYSVDEGSTVRLDGFCLGCTSYAWDFTGNNQFTDATGPTPVFDAAGLDGLDTHFVTMRGCVSANNCVERQGTIGITNVAPQITSPPITFVGANENYRYQARAQDPAGALDPLEWSLVRGPNGMTINSGTGLVSYNGSPGTHTVTIRVRDGDGGQTDQTFDLQVITRGPDNYGYVWQERAHQFSMPPGSASNLTMTDELMSGAIGLGFDFPYYGNDYTNVYISSNGFITLLNNSATGCCSGQELPASAAPNGVIAGYWEDLDPSLGGTISHHREGNAPDRRFFVTFTNIQHAGGGNPVTFQLVLHETTGDFEIRHASCLSDNGNHSTGFENEAGQLGLSIAYGNYSSINRSWYITAPDKSGAGGPYGVDEGGQVTLSGSCNRNVCSSLLWDFDGNGQYDDAQGANPVFSADGYDGPSTRMVGLRACRQPNDCSNYTAVVAIRNANPSFTSQATSRVGRGGHYVYQPTAIDPARTGDPISFSLVSGPNGMRFTSAGRLEWIANTTNNSEQVTIRASDDDGGRVDQSFTITIENRGPDNFGYNWAPTTMSWEDISNTGTALSDPSQRLNDDQMTGSIPLGFIFGYYGAGYSEAYLSTNGFISFRSGQSHGCCSGRRSPDTRNPNAIIAGYWEDLLPRNSGLIHFQTLGSAPNRRFILQFTDVPHHRHTSRLVTMQYVLFEGSNDFELRYLDAQSDGGNHATGFENFNGSDGLSIRQGNYSLVNTAFRITAPPQESAGGPYYVTEGGSITLFGQCNNCSSFAWDFDNDGQYNDATGATPTFSAAGLDGPINNKLVGMRVCNAPTQCRDYSATINIANANPVIVSRPDSTVTAGYPFIYPARATDAANNGGAKLDELTWSIINGPTSMRIHPQRGLVVWTATASYSNLIRVRLRVTDGDGGRADQNFWLHVVNKGPDNFGYTWEEQFFSWTDITSIGTRLRLGDNQSSSAIPIGFDFLYYGRDYSNAYISSNGFLAFLRGQGHGCCQGLRTPNTRAPNAMISGYWANLDPREGSIHYLTRGTAPNREFLVQFTDVPHVNHNTAINTFQIVLYEGRGNFDIRHRQTLPHPTNQYVYATTGFENHTGLDGLDIRWGQFTTRDKTWRVFAPTTPEITTAVFTPQPQPERVDFVVAAATPSQWTVQLRHVPRSGRCEDETGRLLAHRVYSTRTTTAATIGGLSPNSRYCWYAKASSQALRTPDRGIRFDGINEYLAVPDHNSLDFASSFSMSTWIWIDNYPDSGRYATLLHKAHSSDARGVYGLQMDEIGRLGFSISEEGTTRVGVRSGWTQPLATDSWHNVTGVYDAAAGTVSVFVNGSLATVGNWNGAVMVSDRQFSIGQGQWSLWNGYFHGAMDDVALWSRALNGNEISSVHNAGTPPDLSRHAASSSLISWWTMGDDPADDTTDGTGSIRDQVGGNHAVANNTEDTDIIVFDATTAGGATRIESGLFRVPELHAFESRSPTYMYPGLGAVIGEPIDVERDELVFGSSRAQVVVGEEFAQRLEEHLVSIEADPVEVILFDLVQAEAPRIAQVHVGLAAGERIDVASVDGQRIDGHAAVDLNGVG